MFRSAKPVSHPTKAPATRRASQPTRAPVQRPTSLPFSSHQNRLSITVFNPVITTSHRQVRTFATPTSKSISAKALSVAKASKKLKAKKVLLITPFITINKLLIVNLYVQKLSKPKAIDAEDLHAIDVNAAVKASETSSKTTEPAWESFDEEDAKAAVKQRVKSLEQGVSQAPHRARNEIVKYYAESRDIINAADWVETLLQNDIAGPDVWNTFLDLWSADLDVDTLGQAFTLMLAQQVRSSSLVILTTRRI